MMWKNTKSILNFKNLVKLGRYTSVASFSGLRCYQKNKFGCSLLKSQYLRDSVGWKERLLSSGSRQTSKDHLQSSWPKSFKGEESETTSQIMLFCIRLLAPAAGRSYLKDILFFCKKNLVHSPPTLKLPPPAWQTTSATYDYIAENSNGAGRVVNVNKGLIKNEVI